jgi:hypothetical protein
LEYQNVPLPSYALIAMLITTTGATAPGPREEVGAWRASFGELQGPLDSNLPHYGIVRSATLSPDDGKLCAIAWARGIDYDQLKWDESTGRWRVAGTEDTLPPHVEAGARPLVIPGGSVIPRLPREADVYRAGAFLGLAVVDEEGLRWHTFPEDLGPLSALADEMLGRMTFQNDGWHLTLSLCARDPQAPDSKCGIALCSFGVGNPGMTRIVVPDADPRGAPVVFAEGKGLRLFWQEWYWEEPRLPDFLGGQQRTRLLSALVRDGALIVSEQIYECPKRTEDRQFWIVQRGTGRYDLILRERQSDPSIASRTNWFAYVPDVLSKKSARPTRVCDCGMDANGAAEDGPGGEELVWLEDDRDDVVVRHARLQDGKWSAPAELCRGVGWDPESMAFAATRARNGTDSVWLVVWRGPGGRLSYLLRDPAGQWSAPESLPRNIGRRNWLAGTADGAWLITDYNRNLYWMSIKITRTGNDGRTAP